MRRDREEILYVRQILLPLAINNDLKFRQAANVAAAIHGSRPTHLYDMKMKIKSLLCSLALSLCASGSTLAGGLEAVPTAWKLESYSTTGVVVWFAGTPCSNGHLFLAPGSTVTDHNRFYATVMAAKLANAKMFVYYDETKDCTIISYGLV